MAAAKASELRREQGREEMTHDRSPSDHSGKKIDGAEDSLHRAALEHEADFMKDRRLLAEYPLISANTAGGMHLEKVTFRDGGCWLNGVYVNSFNRRQAENDGYMFTLPELQGFAKNDFGCCFEFKLDEDASSEQKWMMMGGGIRVGLASTTGRAPGAPW